MLGNPKLRKAASLGTVAVGVVTLVAPQKAAVLGDRLSLAPRYEDLGDGKFTPRDWYVDATRASGAGMIAAGLTGFVLAARDDDGTDADPAPAETDDEVDVDVRTDDGPVQIDLDDAEDPADD